MTTSLKYARIERERRFLLAGVPASEATGEQLHIVDRYLQTTRLRLRLVRRAGEDPVYKLGQKIRVGAGPSTIAHTTVYLDRAEYEALTQLPGRTLTKTRTLSGWHGLTLAVDVFTGELDGLVLAEVELSESAEPPATGWLSLGDEVTADERFTGGALASTSREQLRALVRGVAPTSQGSPALWQAPGP